MKRILAALLVISVLLLSACGAPAQTGERRGSRKAETPAASSDLSTDRGEKAETPEKTPGAPEIVIITRYASRYSEDRSVCFGTGSVPLFYCGRQLGAEQHETVADDADYPALAAALRTWSEESEKLFEENLDSIESYARGDYANGNYRGAEDSRMAYASRSTAWLVRADEKLVSFCVESYWDAGGVHPYTGHTGENFDSRTGELLQITDLLTEEGEQRFPELFEQALAQQYPYFMEGLLVDSVADAIREEMNDALLYFTADEEGVTVMVNPYDLAAYAAGPAFVTLRAADYPGIFEPEYFSSRDEWTRQLRPLGASGAYSSLNTIRYLSGGRERELSIVFSPDEYGDGAVSVTLDGKTWTDPEKYCYAATPVLMHAKGLDLLYLEYRMGNDWAAISVLDLSGEEPRLVTELWEGFYNQIATDLNGFYLMSRSGCMSTYAISRLYAVSESGAPDPLEEFYTALNAPELTLKKDMEMTRLTALGGGKTVSVPAGEKLTIYRTNNKDLVDLISQTGEIYRVDYDPGDDYMGSVNGVPLEQAFDGVFFAG